MNRLRTTLPSLEGWGGCVVRHMEFHVKTEKKIIQINLLLNWI